MQLVVKISATFGHAFGSAVNMIAPSKLRRGIEHALVIAPALQLAPRIEGRPAACHRIGVRLCDVQSQRLLLKRLRKHRKVLGTWLATRVEHQ